MKSLEELVAKVYTFGQMLVEKYIYIIPGFQREYRWSPKQVRTFVLDAISVISKQSGAKFYGPVTFSSSDADTSPERQIVDGQQRLTTAILLLIATRDRLSSAGTYGELVGRIERMLRTKNEAGEVVNYRITSQHKEANSVLQALIDGRDTAAAGEKAPGLNYVIAMSTVKETLDECFPNNKKLADFISAFLDKAGVAATITGPANAVEIFCKSHETLSPLSELDAFKGRLYDKVPLSKRAEFVDAFHEVQKLLWRMPGRPDRNFLHVLRGMYGSEGRGTKTALIDSVIEEAMKVGPVDWVRDNLLPATQSLSQALDGLHPSGKVCPPLLDISRVERLRKFVALRSLYVAARNLSDKERVELFAHLRNTLVVLFVSASNPPDNDSAVRSWTDLVISGNLSMALSEMKVHRHKHAQAFAVNYPGLGLRNIGRTGVRFMLGLVENYIRGKLNGTPNSCAAVETFPETEYDIEHILPRDTKTHSNFADAHVIVDNLANLTMLESTRNRSIGSVEYSKKLSEYSQSEALITRSMAGSIAGSGKDNKAAQAAALLNNYPTWDPVSLAARSGMLYNILALAVDVPAISTQPIQQSPIVSPTPRVNLPQARPGNTLKVFMLVGKGVIDEEDVAARISGQGEVGGSSRQLDYCVEALNLMGLAERGEDGLGLTDYGKDVFGDIKDSIEPAQVKRLSEVYMATISALPGGKAIVDAYQNDGPDSKLFDEAIKAAYPDLGKSTLEHRSNAVVAWFKEATKPSEEGNGSGFTLL